MGTDDAAGVIVRRRLGAAAEPEKLRRELGAEYPAQLMNPFVGPPPHRK
ncbi:hypothetical protein [Streptacidiphilus sp. MAP5-3]